LLNNKKIIICDIDGCLSPEDPVPMDAHRLLQVAEYNLGVKERGEGPWLTLCSGRPLAFVEALCRYLQNDLLPCLGENGVWLYDPAENEYVMDPAITDEHLEIVVEAARWAKRVYGHKGVSQQPGKNASVTLHHPDVAYLKGVCNEVQQAFDSRSWPFRVTMTWSYINCDLTHISKSTGIQRLFDRTGLQPDDAIGIGDTMSDRAIAEQVSYFACPQNAAEPLKGLSHFVAPGSETQGVLDILEHIQRGNSS
jgi:hydroxymethylpyrimidine pyrophosphatase-like HAD family hydrolase